jgi:hypothetical protein
MARIGKGFWLGVGAVIGAIFATAVISIALYFGQRTEQAKVTASAQVATLTWQRSEEISKLDDKLSLQFRHASREFYSNGIPHRAQLIIGCEKGALAAAIAWNAVVSGEMGREWIIVRHRLDKGSLQEAVWSTTTVPTVSVSREPAALLHSLAGKKEMVAEVQPPFTHVEIEASFDLAGIDDAVAEIGKTCPSKT